MSVSEIKQSILALPPKKRHDLARWLIRMEAQPEEDMVLATALTWRELDREEEQNEKRKSR